MPSFSRGTSREPRREPTPRLCMHPRRVVSSSHMFILQLLAARAQLSYSGCHFPSLACAGTGLSSASSPPPHPTPLTPTCIHTRCPVSLFSASPRCRSRCKTWSGSKHSARRPCAAANRLASPRPQPTSTTARAPGAASAPPAAALAASWRSKKKRRSRRLRGQREKSWGEL